MTKTILAPLTSYMTHYYILHWASPLHNFYYVCCLDLCALHGA